MATATITVASVCSGNNHVVLSISGDVTMSLAIDADRVLEPLTAEDREIAVMAILKFARIGRTKNQLKTLLATTGLVVSA